MTLLLLALLAQAADGAMTCHGLSQGRREVNPFLPKSCAGVLAAKTAWMAPAVVPWKGRTTYQVGMIASGAFGVTFQIAFKSEVAVANAIIVRTGALCSYAVY